VSNQGLLGGLSLNVLEIRNPARDFTHFVVI
jgi:hypothetical protein